MKHLTRRDFAKSAAAASALSALSTKRILGANDRVRLGFIGVGNRGDQVLDAFLKHNDAQVVAICDVYAPYIDFAAKKTGGTPARLSDYRKLLEMKDVDSVVICTPDHWHALQTIHACEAGKDVYVEKPLSLTVVEGRKMVEAAKRTGRVVQVGIQRRSSQFCREAAEVVRSGQIGKVTVAKSYHVLNESPAGIGNPPDGPPPEGLDWDMWLGPAPKVPYNPNRCLYKFRWFYNYSGGQLTNFGTHYMDLIHWALGKEIPLAVTALGGKFGLADNREVPDTMEVLWSYPGGTLVVFSQYNCNAAAGNAGNALVEFRGTRGTLYITSNGYEVAPENITEEEVPARSPLKREEQRRYGRSAKPAMNPITVKGRVDDADHARNFLDCVKSRKMCNCDIETAHRSTTATLIGNIALKTKSYLEWDGKAERFTNNESANRLLHYQYRRPWKLS